MSRPPVNASRSTAARPDKRRSAGNTEPAGKTAAEETRRSDDESGPTLILEEFLPFRLSVLTNIVSRALARLYEQRFGISVAEWRTIAILARFGPLSANGVCERSAMDKVQVSRAVARAVQNGLIERGVDRTDRRRSVLTLTPHGRAVHDRIVPLAEGLQARLLATLDPEEPARLDRILDRLTSHARALDTKGE